jgi:dihydrofolate synthase/folylpolyglutamate synthase
VAEHLGRPLDEEKACSAARRVRFPGRCAILELEPLVLLDGAVHRCSAREVARLLRRLPPPRGAVVAVPEDKDWRGVVSTLGPEVAFLCFTRPRRNPFLRFPEGASEWARERGFLAWEEEGVEVAVEAARARLGGKGSLAVVGTQSLVGEALALWRLDPRNLW